MNDRYSMKCKKTKGMQALMRAKLFLKRLGEGRNALHNPFFCLARGVAVGLTASILLESCTVSAEESLEKAKYG